MSLMVLVVLDAVNSPRAASQEAARSDNHGRTTALKAGFVVSWWRVSVRSATWMAEERDMPVDGAAASVLAGRKAAHILPQAVVDPGLIGTHFWAFWAAPTAALGDVVSACRRRRPVHGGSIGDPPDRKIKEQKEG
ncbi:hypothetical protein B0T21DRAFT_351060 [Apiosordaria backusii]|uniref:Uncharacterized protein n=1 Tax=Apiosordaria backusii TaxID=314023 RepID=A0AA40AXM1_9PEZI|nr:hypothetical protein B0T21DRAFT_351060 [Apiosordaria backusii]